MAWLGVARARRGDLTYGAVVPWPMNVHVKQCDQAANADPIWSGNLPSVPRIGERLILWAVADGRPFPVIFGVLGVEWILQFPAGQSQEPRVEILVALMAS